MSPGFVTARWRVGVTAASALVLLVVIVGTFWWQDWRYERPTPKPAGLQQVSIGTVVTMPPALERLLLDRRPVVLHFFQAECPCSRFNLEHLRVLQHRFGRAVQFVAVLQDGHTERSLRTFQRLHLSMPAIPDGMGQIASAYGVYATPQVVVLDSDRKLQYRGNYNTSRYCADPRTEFARLALQAVVAGQQVPRFGAAAETAYGCPLPKKRAGAGA